MGRDTMESKGDVIQAVLDKIRGKRYLEIGVYKRENFNKITAKQKIGVDPYYGVSNKILSKFLRLFPILCSCHKLLKRGNGEDFFQMTSSRFFEEHAAWLALNTIDVCLVDGSHTYVQTLNDVMDCLKYLGHSGVIVIHDCNPTSAAMAHPVGSYDEAAKMKLPGWTNEWCGDVWKVIVYLRSQCPDLRICVLNLDYGLGIVTRGKPDGMLTYSKEEIDRMTYKDLDGSRATLLNIKEPEYLDVLLKSM
jgi:hypothetical protein